MGVHRDTDTETADEEGFAERWSRRKQAARQEPGEQPLPSDQPVNAVAAEPQAELTDADMPPLESLDERSDYAGFLSPGVSEQLRAQALRKLFQLPGLHLPDGLDDYDDDFTRFSSLGDTITHELQRMLDRESARTDDAIGDQPGDGEEPAAEVSAESDEAIPETPIQAATDTAQDGGDDAHQAEGKS